jgi:DNA-binding NarL/FixJ family response regulator
MNKSKYQLLPYSHPYYLSDREMAVLKAISKGHTNKEIAEEMKRSKRTIDKYRENLLMKSNSKNTAQMISNAYKYGWL